MASLEVVHKVGNGRFACYTFSMKIKIIAAFCILIFIAVSSSTAQAGEIQYGHIEAVQGDTVYIQYQGPAGLDHFLCDADTTTCKQKTEAPTLLPAINGQRTYTTSPDGQYGIVGKRLGVAAGRTLYVHQLYDVSGSEAVSVATIPYLKATTKYKFSWSNEQVALFGSNGEVLMYDIASKRSTTVTPASTSLPLTSLSPAGTYLSFYNYTRNAHEIINTTTGATKRIRSELPVYVEFSQDETQAAFVDDRSGYKTLYTVPMDTNRTTLTRVFADDFVVEDYVWYQDRLYAIGNTEDNPFRWVLYEYDPATDEVTIVAEDVSYGDYLQPVGKYGLSFLTIVGKNSHVALYQHDINAVKTISPVADSPASDMIERRVVTLGESYGVLYAPKEPDDEPELFLWLHGGPKRQTSLGYHSYRSYAVYDELLERLTESGAYVLKLDYPGSYGYSTAFMEQLESQLGVVDVKQVVDAARELQETYNIDDTYLIGNSYGGYLGPKVLVDHPDDFTGAIAINGVFDWFDLIKRIPSSPFSTYFKGPAQYADPLQNFSLYTQASITNNLTTLPPHKKLLVVYGALDSTVPTWQSTEFYDVAATLGKDASLLRFDDEDHILRKRENLDVLCVFIRDELRISDLSCIL